MVKNIKKSAPDSPGASQIPARPTQPVPINQMPDTTPDVRVAGHEDNERLLDDATLAGIGLGLIGATIVIIVAYLML
jgi:hypothetical protein